MEVCFRFVSALPEVGKCVFVFQEPCPSWANVFLFFKSFARAGQAIYFFILPLPAPGKPLFFLNTTNICLLCFTANGFAIFFAQDAVFRFRFAQIQTIASDKRRNFCSLTHESSRISRRRSLLAHHFINFKKPFYCFMIS